MVVAETSLGCGLLFSNVFRLQRQFQRDEIPDNAGNVVWKNCDGDLAIHGRDCMLACAVLLTRAIFCNLFSVRTKFAWIAPVCETICFAFLLFSPSQRLNDGGSSSLLFAIVTAASFGILAANRIGEKNHRDLWALLRMKNEESVWQQELLHLVFPVVLHVQQGSIMPNDAFKQHFGVDVPKIEDLLSDSDGHDLAIAALVKEVETTRTPAKRNLTFWSRNATQKCNA